MDPTHHDRIAALRLLIEALPRPTDFAVRHDGVSLGGVFTVVDALRMELHGHIGDLADGRAVYLGDSSCTDSINATAHDKQRAYQLVLDAMPRRNDWLNAFSSRMDGSTAEGIFAVLDDVRMNLHVRIGSLIDNSSGGSTHVPR